MVSVHVCQVKNHELDACSDAMTLIITPKDKISQEEERRAKEWHDYIGVLDLKG